MTDIDNACGLTPPQTSDTIAFSVASRWTARAEDVSDAIGPSKEKPVSVREVANIAGNEGPAQVEDLSVEADAAQRSREESTDWMPELATISTIDRPVIAQKGFRGFLGRLGIRLQPGENEKAENRAMAEQSRDEEIVRQATWTRAVSVLVANRKGGVGKTPVSLMLGGTLAAVRAGSVCILEVSDDPGALTYRSEGHPRLGLGELMRDVDTITSAGQLAGYTAPQTSFASVVGTTSDRARLTHDDVIALSATIDRYYSIRLMDSGNQSSSSAFDGAVETADVLVIPVLNAPDAVYEAIGLLERLRSDGGKAADLAKRAIILRLTDGRPEHARVLERVDRILADSGAAEVFNVPYDAHIAERGQITLGSLNPITRRVFAAVAAGVVRSLHSRSQPGTL